MNVFICFQSFEVNSHYNLILVIGLECRPHLQRLSPLLSQGSQLVPQVTDALAALVHSSHVMVVQLTGKTKHMPLFGSVVEKSFSVSAAIRVPFLSSMVSQSLKNTLSQ